MAFADIETGFFDGANASIATLKNGDLMRKLKESETFKKEDVKFSQCTCVGESCEFITG